MINLKQNETNSFIIYADTISNDINTYGDYFLVGFINGFTKYWTYVVPNVLRRNKRFVELEIELVNDPSGEDPLNGKVYLNPIGNYDYKVWNMDNPDLDPATGNQIDQGQMVLTSLLCSEVELDSYISDNETLQAIVYASASDTLKNVLTYTSNNETLQAVVYYTGCANIFWNTTPKFWNLDSDKWNNA